jgi:carboxyl-terminal processing protease
MQTIGNMTVRLGLAVFFGALLFGTGVYVGYNDRPAIDKVAGVFNIEEPQLSSEAGGGDIEIKTCIDENGADVPCVLDRDDIAEKNDAPADFGQFWAAWNVINEKYVPTKSSYVNNQEKVWGAITGLADSLGDPYTYFLPPQEKSLFEQEVRGIFGGVGMQIGMRDGFVTVIAPLKDSPAEKAGILKGDKVLVIDGATTTDMTIDKALYLIRGEVNTAVNLTLIHENAEETYDVTVVREEIKVPTIDTETKDGVFIIRLYGFPATGSDLFREAMREFALSGSDKLILDLRGNPGGYLEIAVDMASWFLPQGKVVVREEAKDGPRNVYRSRGYDAFEEDDHIVILVDGGSASASEILAGALGQHGVATLVGTQTFGKGSVQELIEITPETSLKVTIARWITPNGTSLSEGGIKPDIEVGITKEDVEAGLDPQLDRAIEVAKEKGRLKLKSR